MSRRRNGELDYATIHWGRQPTGKVQGKVLYGPAIPVGEIVAVSYAADKQESGKVYRHEFEKHDGRGPMLLMEAPAGVQGEVSRIPNAPGDMIELGQLLDFELKDGRRVVVGGAQLAISPDGERLVISSERGVPLQIEQRQRAHVVTEHGIEG